MNNIELKNITIWITGASKGIGKAIADCFYDSEANLVISASSHDSFLDSSLNKRDSSMTMFLPFDLSSLENIRHAYKAIEERYCGVDILINNAGIGIFKPFSEISEEDFDKTIDINLKAPFFLSQLVIEGMKKRKSGMIVNISSVAAKTVFEDCSIYSASKAGLLMMSQCVLEEVRNDSIKVMNVLPGATNTKIWSSEMRQQYFEKMMDPNKIGEIVVNSIIASINSNAIIEEVIIKPQTGDI